MEDEVVTAIALRQDRYDRQERQLDRLAFEPQNWQQAIDTAEALSKSGLLPADLRNPAAIVAVIMQGRELGLTTMQSIRGIHIIKGKPVVSAALMVALVRESGLAEYFTEVCCSDKLCTYATKRVGADEKRVEVTWTIEKAQVAGLRSKDNWKQFPDAMLRARASSELARAVYPDVLFGIYTPDEEEALEKEKDKDPPANGRKRGAKAVGDATTILAEARAIVEKYDTAQAPEPTSTPAPPPEPAPESLVPPKLQVVPSTNEPQEPESDANQSPEVAEKKPADGEAPHSTASQPAKERAIVTITEFWKRLRALKLDQKNVLGEVVELFGAQPGQMAPELRGVYVLIKEAGLSVSDVACDLADNFGITSLPETSVEAWLMFASLLEGGR